MKFLFFIVSFALISLTGTSQTFYVEPTEKGFEKDFIEKMRFDGYDLTKDEDSADYIVKLFIKQSDQVATIYQGFITVEDDSGNTLSKSTVIKTTATVANRYNAAGHIFKKIYDKQFPKMVASLKTN